MFIVMRLMNYAVCGGMNIDEFTRKKAIDLLKSKVLTDRELARFLTELAFGMDWQATVIKAQRLQVERMK